MTCIFLVCRPKYLVTLFAFHILQRGEKEFVHPRELSHELLAFPVEINGYESAACHVLVNGDNGFLKRKGKPVHSSNIYILKTLFLKCSPSCGNVSYLIQ